MYTKENIFQDTTGCSLNIVFFGIVFKYSGLLPFSVFPLCQCEYRHQSGRTPALQQNWQSSEILRKNTIFNKHAVRPALLMANKPINFAINQLNFNCNIYFNCITYCNKFSSYYCNKTANYSCNEIGNTLIAMNWSAVIAL